MWAAGGGVLRGVPVQRGVPRGSAGAARRGGRLPRAHRLQGGAEDALHQRDARRAVLPGGQPAAGRLRRRAQRQIRLRQTGSVLTSHNIPLYTSS